jgi:type IV pilus assembly protein PilN
MILINLLPHREAARKRQKEQFFTQLACRPCWAASFAGAVFTWYQGQISAQQDRNAFLSAKLPSWTLEIKDIANLQREIASLRARQTAVEDLQATATCRSHLLNELVRSCPTAFT